jgi:hypothetical protein
MFSRNRAASLSTLKYNSVVDMFKGSLRLCVHPSSEDLSTCAVAYFKNFKDPLIPMDLQACQDTLRTHVLNGNYIATIHDGKSLVGFVAGSSTPHPYSKAYVVSMDIYFSSCKGLKGAHSLMLAGRGLIEYAKCKNVDYVVATHNYNVDDNFNNILEHDGWVSRRYTSVFNLRRK